MEANDFYLLFTLHQESYALPLASVERVVRMVEITPLPQAPAAVLGIVNVHGRVIPVFDMRCRFALPQRLPDVYDRLIVAHTRRRTVALAVDAVQGVETIGGQEITGKRQLLPQAGYIDGVFYRGQSLVMIHDIDTFLSLDEEKKLDAVM